MAELIFLALGGFSTFNYLAKPSRKHTDADAANWRMQSDITRPYLFGSMVNERYAGTLNPDVDTEFFADDLRAQIAYQDATFSVDEDQDPLMDINTTHPERRNPGIEVWGDMTMPDLDVQGEGVDYGFSETILGGVDYTKTGVVPEEEEA